jgi:Na+/H+-translocating membrane pyrophosphatase
MLQRIQTLFLLLAAVALGALLFFHWGNVYDTQICPKHLFNIVALFPNILLSVGILLSIVTIFFYKKRKTQILLCNVNIFLIVCFYVSYTSFYGLVDLSNYYFVTPIVLPLVALIFIFLAKKHIKKDEKLVRSLDRIR